MSFIASYLPFSVFASFDAEKLNFALHQVRSGDVAGFEFWLLKVRHALRMESCNSPGCSPRLDLLPLNLF